MPATKDTARLACVKNVGVNSKAIDWRHKRELGLHSCDVMVSTVTILLNFFSVNFLRASPRPVSQKLYSLCNFSGTGINSSIADLF